MLAFDNALAQLRKRHSPSYDAALSYIGNIKLLFQVYLAYRQLFPADYQDKLKEFGLCDWHGDANLGDKILCAVASLFPINDAMMDEEPHTIYIEAQNLSMSWDEFDEMLNDVDQVLYQPDVYAFPVLCWSIGNGIDRDTWEALSENLDWDVPYPEYLVSNDTYVDFDRLRVELETAGLGDFFASIQMAWRSSDNYFIDFDPNSDMDYRSFSAENLCDLAAEWKEAIPIIEADSRAMERLKKDKSLFTQIVSVMERCALERPTHA